ncbi:multidrug ABC transporter substrate-binding protein [Candidatus Methylomirabilis limnetica]|jgi:putative ABC transport system permease protein|uniref:Multidrug ABC transporter substrate-binding protein n=1 Tax=Candidatus Methylomirabilis limnetica TaxID=2033718 RepID=A0A2T4TYL3_9BACT|nr:ABC transporter permease [Candidatus Methylomirabilis limnetica]PTL36215.1 multidrug ABC transporter substrate-binding protein [Candidatus Methylomirabilis limnetica]
MNILANVRIALRALRVNRLRSALTMLGIIIGVAAVIATVAVGSGATAQIQEQIRSIGSNVIIVLSGSATSGGIRVGAGSVMTLSEDDAKAIAGECPAVALTASSVRGTGQVVLGNDNWSTVIQGVTPEYLEIRDFRVLNGRPFTWQDVDGAAKVALVGDTIVKNLFGGTDPVGQIIRIKKVPFTVLGSLSPKGQSAWGQDQDDVILIPISTAKRKVLGVSQANARAVGAIVVQARGPMVMREAEEQVVALLRQRHRLQPEEDNDFTVRNLVEVFGAQEQAARVMSILLGAIASVSLVVGGIGIMNIMLVSVTERTREIGLRLAVGAKAHDILTQFLVEAVTLSLIGGLVGIALGLSVSVLISYFAMWSTQISGGAVLMAFAFSALVGICFGYYPARKAAFLDPIEALRYE